MYILNRMHSNFNVSNLVMVAKLSNSILNLDMLFKCMVIHKVNFTIGDKIIGMGRETVPFFGHNGIIIGLKYGKSSRGIVRPKGHLSNLIGIDIQYNDKNHNLKLGNNKIQLTGAKTEDSGIKVYQLLVEHFKMTNSNITNVIEMKEEVKNSILNWIKDNYVDEIDNTKLKPYESCVEILNKSKYINPKEIQCIKYFTSFIVEFEFYEDYVNKLKDIIKYKTSFISILPKLTNAKTINGLYTYSLGQKFSLNKICQFLGKVRKEDGRLRYGVSFHNWNSKVQSKIIAPIDPNSASTSPNIIEVFHDDEEDGEDTSSSKKRLPAHRFIIRQNGTVRQYSPTSSEYALQQYLQLVNDFEDFIKL